MLVQARMGSTRLPGKTLMEIGGKPLIWYVVKRLEQIKGVDQIVILTSRRKIDDVLVQWCKNNGISVFRGSEENVLERYFEAAQHYGADCIIRATGDNPFVDFASAGSLVKKHLEKKADYSSNKSEVGSTLPDGLGIEIFSYEALKVSLDKSSEPHHFEHVNEYILENKKLFRLYEDQTAGGEKDYSGVRLTVDTEEDFKKANYIITHPDYRIDGSFEDLLDVEKTYLN